MTRWDQYLRAVCEGHAVRAPEPLRLPFFAGPSYDAECRVSASEAALRQLAEALRSESDTGAQQRYR